VSTARVNLLPPELARRERVRRINFLVMALVALYLVGLALLYTMKVGQVQAARDGRDREQEVVTALQADLARLEEFRQLAETLDEREDLLILAMGTEVSFAGVLNDLSLSLPSSSSLRTLTIALEDPTAAPGGSVGTPAPPPTRVEQGALPSIGTLTFEGYSVERFAPGVESVVLQVDEVESITGAFVQQAQTELIGPTEVTSFSGVADLDQSAYTGRYAEGLPADGDSP